jgi:hypothetical protein
MEVIMGVKQELWEYFMNHTTGRRSLKGAVHGIIAFTMDAADEIIDLILKRLKRSEITFVESNSAYFEHSRKELHFPYKITPSHRNTALHEMGHAVDFISCERIEEQVNEHSTRTVFNVHYTSGECVLSNGKTLDKTVREELKLNGARIYSELLSRFNREVLDKLGADVSENYLTVNARLIRDDSAKYKYRVPHQTIASYRENKAKIDAMYELRNSMTLSYDERYSLFELRKVVTKSTEYSRFCDRYDTLIDMISGVENTKYLWPGHSRSYMKRKGGFGVEFFADVFSSTATKNTSDLEFVAEFLPNSYSAFKEVLEHLKAVA